MHKFEKARFEKAAPFFERRRAFWFALSQYIILKTLFIIIIKIIINSFENSRNCDIVMMNIIL